ncbi:hypothetical protein HAX54_003068 [Datura stramonium]|uniref:Uncharacterized protein n=1 Tax=Datura stramonium TaxID=4076 RepID=A0ABS8T638_DATST|nr:hypothetical protein [Datura stramonium]
MHSMSHCENIRPIVFARRFPEEGNYDEEESEDDDNEAEESGEKGNSAERSGNKESAAEESGKQEKDSDPPTILDARSKNLDHTGLL